MAENFDQDERTPAEAPRRRRNRLILLTIITFGLIASLVALGTVKPLFPVPERATDTLLLYTLSSINFIASLVLLSVLTRNLLKLRRERAEQRLGSKFKTKMVIFSIGISLLPGILLFFFAYGLLNTSVDIWFTTPSVNFFNKVEGIKGKLIDREIEEVVKSTLTMMRVTGLRGKAQSLLLDEEDFRMLQSFFNRQQLLFLEITTEQGTLFRLGGDDVHEVTQLATARNEAMAGRTYGAVTDADLSKAHIVIGLPIQQASKPVGGVYVVRKLPDTLAEGFAEIARQADNREELTRRAKQIKITNLYLLGAMTLLLIFAATWIALYVARGITVPIQALAEATEAVARGDLATRVRCPAEDELAILIQSFNQMAAQLGENRENLERAAAQLRVTNRELEERRHYIETILESLSTGIISLDDEHRLITINQAALKILRCQSTPAAGTPVDRLFDPESRAELLRLVLRARRTGQLTRQFELHTGAPVHTAVTITPLRDNRGVFHGSVLMIEDISDLITAQRSAVWSEVARRMAHEIKNPLTPIQLSAERIAKNSLRISGSLDRKYTQMVEECTTTIKQEVGTLQRMVDEFSRFARLPQPAPEPASLNEVVSETLKLYDERLDGIQISTSLCDDLPLLNLDREQIKRALVNLIDNAVEAMSDGNGDRLLSIGTEHLRERELARLTVSDTGHGIAPGDSEKLFQPYFSTRKRGTGLGLAIVSHIITDHSGKIMVEENRPRGTRFIIELPTVN